MTSKGPASQNMPLAMAILPVLFLVGLLGANVSILKTTARMDPIKWHCFWRPCSQARLA